MLFRLGLFGLLFANACAAAGRVESRPAPNALERVEQPQLDTRATVLGQIPAATTEFVVLSSSPPPIDDGWSVTSRPDDRRAAVSDDGAFTLSWELPAAGFHRIRIGKRTVELLLTPGARAEVQVDPEHTVTFQGDHASDNQFLHRIDLDLTETRRALLEADTLRATYSLAAPEFRAHIASLQDAFEKQHRPAQAVHPLVVRRAKIDVQATFDTFRLFYPTLFQKFTGSPPAAADTYRKLMYQAALRPEDLSSRRVSVFLDTYARFESAGGFGDQDAPREKLFARYRAITAMPAVDAVKSYLLAEMFRMFQVNYGPADWGPVLQAFANDWPAHPSLSALRDEHREAMERRAQADEIRVFRRVDGIELEAHIFFPEEPGNERSVFATFHGGGWAIGTPEWSYPIAARMAARGMVAISFEYRIADVHGTAIPAAIEDTKAAIAWTRDNATRLGVRPDRVVSHGFSAGAHLAGLNAIRASSDPSSKTAPNALILHSSTYNTTKSSFFSTMTGGRPKSISLTHQVRGGLVPTLLLHGKHDHLAPESEFAEFVQQMKNVGNDFEFHLFDVGHFFRNRAARNEVTALIDRFLRSRGFLETREERIRKQMSRSNVPGTAVAYVRDCRLTEVLTLGTANSETGAPVQPSTVFEAASLSKPVFALLFLRAVASGYATLDAPFGDAVPNPRIKDSKAYAHVTPRMLLAHRSGLPNWSGPSRDLDRLDPLVFAFPPGDSFAYSGEGYFMLQRQLESLRDTELADLFHAELAPVMPLSSFGAIAAGALTSHGHGADGLASSGRPLSASPPIAAYSLKTVAADYGRFVAYVCAGADLPDLLFEEMLRPQSPAPADHYGASADALGSGTISWALGWGVQRTYDRAIHFHWGDNGAFKAFAAFDRKSGNGVVYFANGKNSLELVPAIVEPVVGSMKPVRAWLN